MKTLKIEQYAVLVDDEDYDRLKAYRWRAHNYNGKVYIEMGNHSQDNFWKMSDFIMGVPPQGYIWDHKNGDTLNHQRSNLRLATHAQNCANKGLSKNNTSGFKGVSFIKREQKWAAQIKVDYKNKFLGYFKSPQEAAAAYNIAALKHFGEFAKLNHIN